jgi:hypothetical protein
MMRGAMKMAHDSGVMKVTHDLVIWVRGNCVGWKVTFMKSLAV